MRTQDGCQVDGEILVLANGYELPPFVPAKIHRITSTWAIATGTPAGGRDVAGSGSRVGGIHTLTYMRTTNDGRIIFGRRG